MKHDIVILITICSLNNHFKKLINPYYKYVTEADKKKKKGLRTIMTGHVYNRFNEKTEPESGHLAF